MSRIEDVTVPDGRFDLHVWTPQSGSGPGLLLIQEIFGVGPYIKAVAERLAGAGYVVGAPDVFWRVQPGWASDHSDDGLAASMGVAQQFDPVKGAADCVAALNRLSDLPEVTGVPGVIGFCLGGTLAHLVGAAADPSVVVSYYGTGVRGTVERFADIKCPALYLFGALDPYIPRADIDAVVAAAADHPNIDVEVYDAGHAFDNHEAPSFYQADAADASWSRTLAFLGQHLRA
jgi:carboxymethylenebutenolidase